MVQECPSHTRCGPFFVWGSLLKRVVEHRTPEVGKSIWRPSNIAALEPWILGTISIWIPPLLPWAPHGPTQNPPTSEASSLDPGCRWGPGHSVTIFRFRSWPVQGCPHNLLACWVKVRDSYSNSDLFLIFWTVAGQVSFNTFSIYTRREL